MFTLPGSNAPTETTTPLPEGTHKVRLVGIKMIEKNGKIVVNYQDATGSTFDDWLGFNTDPQAKRSYAYLCRLHEIAGLPVPKGSVDDAALLAAHSALDLWIKLETNDRGYVNLADFPTAVGAAHAQAVAGGEPLF